jgi:hypothetical protein
LNRQIIPLVIALLLLAGCGSRTPEYKDVNYFEGSDGVTFEFMENSPPERVFTGRSFPIAVMLSNKGAWNLAGDFYGSVSISYDPFYFEEPEQSKSALEGKRGRIELRGKSAYWPTGEERIETFAFLHPKDISPRAGAESTVMVSLCYPYATLLTTQVCVDADPYNLDEREQICEGEDLTFTDQGAPVAVTFIDYESIPAGVEEISALSYAPTTVDGQFAVHEIETLEAQALIRPVFEIHIEDVGDGHVVRARDFGEMKLCAPGETIEQAKKFVVALKNVSQQTSTGPSAPQAKINEMKSKGYTQAWCGAHDCFFVSSTESGIFDLALQPSDTEIITYQINFDSTGRYISHERFSSAPRWENTPYWTNDFLPAVTEWANRQTSQDYASGSVLVSAKLGNTFLTCFPEVPVLIDGEAVVTCTLPENQVIPVLTNYHDILQVRLAYVYRSRKSVNIEITSTQKYEPQATISADCSDFHRRKDLCKIYSSAAKCSWCEETQQCTDQTCVSCGMNVLFNPELKECVQPCPDLPHVVEFAEPYPDGVRVSCTDPQLRGKFVDHTRCGCGDFYYAIGPKGSDCKSLSFKKISGNYHEASHRTYAALQYTNETKVVCAYAEYEHDGETKQTSVKKVERD